MIVGLRFWFWLRPACSNAYSSIVHFNHVKFAEQCTLKCRLVLKVIHKLKAISSMVCASLPWAWLECVYSATISIGKMLMVGEFLLHIISPASYMNSLASIMAENIFLRIQVLYRMLISICGQLVAIPSHDLSSNRVTKSREPRPRDKTRQIAKPINKSHPCRSFLL